ncbi:MAG TPA: T9SS type A sorting domain-containing protein [Rubricoccaceae bacterium]|jgi:hypothetical protein
MRLSTLWRPLALPILALALAAPASAQYQVAPIAPGFVDISATGTPVTAAQMDEGISATITFATIAPPTPPATTSPFTFSFFGVAKSGFRVSSNGFLTFAATSPGTGPNNANAVPLTATPNDYVAPFWDDLDYIAGTGSAAGQVDYQYDAANNRIIVQWTNVRRFIGNGGAANLGDLTFQAHLYSTGVVEFHYATMTDPGNSYTAAIENAAGTAGRALFINPTSGGIASNTSYQFIRDTTTPVFYVNQQGVNFPSGGPCVSAPSTGRGVVVTASNQGGGALTVGAPTITGPSASAFRVENQVPTAGTALTAGQTSQIVVRFNPIAGQTGPQNATLNIPYNDGTDKVYTVALSGSADAEGAGFVYRSTASTAECTNGATAPSGSAFIDIASHTRITTWTGGDGGAGYFLLDLTANAAVSAFGPFRFFGTDNAFVQISPDGIVAPTPTATNAGLTNFTGSTFVSGLSTIEVNAMDLTVGTATVDYDTADPAQYPVGVYYGLSDTNGDGVQELVITYYHAYDAGSPNYTAAGAGLPSTARYLTTQLVLFQSPQANREDLLEVRYIDGLDPTGTPYRLNTASTATGTTPSIENDLITGITERLGLESALYHYRSSGNAGLTTNFGIGGPIYDAAEGNVAVRFEAEVQALAMGNAGWRMMGAPIQNYLVDRLARVNLVQGVAGQYPTAPGSNLRIDYDGSGSSETGYIPAASINDLLVPGQGFIWYLYNQNITPTSPAPHGAGTSRSFALPMALEATGAEPSVAGTVTGPVSTPLFTTGDRFNLVANPFRDDLDVSNLGTFASGGTLTSAVPQVWDPNTGATGSYVMVTGSVATWQGFFVQNGTATALTFPTNARNTTGTFLGLTGDLYSNARTANPARLAFELAGTDAATGQPTLDKAAALVFSATGADEWDLLDASKLSPLANAFATVAFQGELDGVANLKAQESRSLEAASFDVPMVVDAVGTAPSLTLSWGDLSVLPATWSLELRDVVTGQTVDLRAQTSYTFDQTSAPARGLSPEAILSETTVAAQRRATDASRFVLHVETARTTATEDGAPAEFALAAPSPNPTAGAAVVSFDVPEASSVSVSVYDLLGRRVAVLAEGEMAAGRHTSRLEAGTLAPGVYVIRMQAGTFAATRRVTVVR